MLDAALVRDFSYAPSRPRAEAIDASVRTHLAESLVTIANALEQSGVAAGEPLLRLAGRARRERVRPEVFALYTRLADAIEHDDDGAMRASLARIAAPHLLAAAAWRIADFSAESLGEGVPDLYLDVFDDDDEQPLRLRAVGPAEFSAGAGCVHAALTMLDEAAPEIAGEARAFFSEAVFATSRGLPAPAGFPAIPDFSSGTSVYIWGAVFVDPAGLSPVAMAEVLAHESAHALLTGLTEAQDLSANDKAARYASPLRPEPRPMEGIVHATFVLGRMILAMERIARRNSLGATEREEAAERLRSNILLFREGLSTIRQHAVLTDVGSRALEGCLAMGRELQNA